MPDDLSRLLRRAKYYMLLDSLLGVLGWPLRLVVWVVKAGYLLFCMVAWGITLWVLGERHIGILKMLIFLASLSFWVLVYSSAVTLWPR